MVRPTASLGSRDKRFSLPSSNWLLVPILPWEHPKVRTLGGWHQSPRPGVTPPGWGYARERWGRSSLGHHLYLAWDIEPKVRTLRSIQHLHVDDERSEVNGGAVVFDLSWPPPHTHMPTWTDPRRPSLVSSC